MICKIENLGFIGPYLQSHLDQVLDPTKEQTNVIKYGNFIF